MNKFGGQQAQVGYIDVDDPHERRAWSKCLGISEQELVEAVRAVGGQEQKVHEYLHLKEGTRNHGRAWRP